MNLSPNPATHEDLQRLMDFDHVIRVHEGGVITSEPNFRAPEFDDDVLYGDGWELMSGYTGQYGYRGPIMHESEYIGGRLADDILATPGVYVVIVATATPDEADDDEPQDDNIVGWAIARRTA